MVQSSAKSCHLNNLPNYTLQAIVRLHHCCTTCYQLDTDQVAVHALREQISASPTATMPAVATLLTVA